MGQRSSEPRIARQGSSAVLRDGFLSSQAAISNERPAITRGLAKIGIRWTCPQADIDIYARGTNTSEFLYFSHRETVEGHFPHDYLAAPGEAAFEYVEFTRDIDLRTAEAFINFYGGKCPDSPAGIIRIWFGDHTYEGRFVIAAREGNQGGKPAGQMTGEHWTRIDIKKIVHLE
jgi:hypothetical protein